MIQIQLNITTQPDGGVNIAMNKLEREDANADERELAQGMHDMLAAVLLETVQQHGGPDSTMTMIDADGERPVDWRNPNA